MQMEDNATIEQMLVSVLREKKLKITTAESCTGGLISGTIVNVPGASYVLEEAYVTYSNEAKMKLLGVQKDILEEKGAVSEETAYQMAFGAAKASGADCSIAVTGIAGPDGGSEDKPVGTVYAGFYVCGNVWAERYNFTGDRAEVRRQTVDAVLNRMFKSIESI